MWKAAAAMSLVGGAVTASTYVSDGRTAAQAARYVGTALVLAAMARLASRRRNGWRIHRPAGREWLWLIAAATAGLTLYNLALVEALKHAEAPMVASIVSGVPLALAIAAPLAARRVIAPRLVVGAAVVVAGSFLVFGAGRSDTLGVVLAVTALACECAFTLLGVPVLERLGALSIATHTAWIAAVQLCVLAVVSGDITVMASWDQAEVVAIAYLIGASAAAFVLWFDAIGTVGAERAGLAAGVIAIAALATGVPLGAARLTSGAVIGTAVVVAGIAVGLRRPRDLRTHLQPGAQRRDGDAHLRAPVHPS